MEIFTQSGGAILSRWTHVLFGIAWVGLLYYFNFVQVPSFAQFDAGPRTESVRKLVPRALWWFRWAALFTFITGLLILGFQEQYDGDYFQTTRGTTILTGILLGLVMLTNVWMVIWPNQQVVIASADRVAGGGEADPGAAPAGRRALLASRTNALFSIPMLFYMVAAPHFVTSRHFDFDPGGSQLLTYWLIVLALVTLLELNGLGLIGGPGPGPTKQPLENHRATIIAGFVLWAVLYVVLEATLRA